MSVSPALAGSSGDRFLTDRVCVITGASSGIGRRTALDLAAAGAKVCVAARRQERLEGIGKRCRARSRVRNERNGAHGEDNFGKNTGHE